MNHMQNQENSDASAFLAINDHLQHLFDSIGAQDNRVLMCFVMSNLWMRLSSYTAEDIVQILTRSKDLVKSLNPDCTSLNDIDVSLLK